MDKLRAMETFIAIADNGSLTEAGLRLDRSLPTVVRTLAELEAHLGVRLFNRTTRRIDLTAEGRDYLDHCRRMLADLAAAEDQLRDGPGTIAGHVSVTAPVLFGELHVAPAMVQLTNAHPGLSLRLYLADRIVDLLENHLDLAVRIGALPDSSLMARRVGEVRQVLCAAPGLLAKLGCPTRPEELSAFPCLRNDGNTAGGRWAFRDPESGKAIHQPVRGRLSANAVRPLAGYCCDGAGLALFLSYQVADALAEGRLVEVLPHWQPPPLAVHIVHGFGPSPPRRVEKVAEALANGISTRLRGPSREVLA
jgi:DNA-binding transcriptional LysR family regulator